MVSIAEIFFFNFGTVADLFWVGLFKLLSRLNDKIGLLQK